MSINVNERTLSAALFNRAAEAELKEALNLLIDSELNSDKMDTELVDECIELLLELEKDGVQSAPCTLADGSTLLDVCHKRTFKKHLKLKRALLIAAVAAIAATVTVASTPVLAEQMRSIINYLISNTDTAAKQTYIPDTKVRSLYGRFNKLNTEVESEEDIDLSDMEIIAVYEDKSERVIPLNECAVVKTKDDSLGKDKVLVTVSYEGSAFSILFTLR